MIKYGNYVMVANIEELREDIIWEDKNAIRVASTGVFHIKYANFPQCFKYDAVWDNHCCGDYFPCDKTEMITTIENEIEELKILKNLVDNI